MTRLYADPVEVRTRAAAGGPVPEQFAWRGRRYQVTEVLARWTATGPWWREAGTTVGTALEKETVPETEQDWWRVTAAGRASGPGAPGTYDLCFSWATGSWTVRRVQD